MREKNKLFSQAVPWTVDEKLALCDRILPVFNQLQIPLKDAVQEAHVNPPAVSHKDPAVLLNPVSEQDFWDGLYIDYGTHFDKKTQSYQPNDPLKDRKFQNRQVTDANGDPLSRYEQMDVQDWLKYLYLGGGRLMSAANKQSYAVDQDLFFEYFQIDYEYRNIKDKRHCLFAGEFSMALNDCINIRNNYTHRSVANITSSGTYQILPVMQQLMEPLCNTVWPKQKACQERMERLPEEFYAALGEVAFPVSALMEAGRISASFQTKVEQLLLGAGVSVDGGNAYVYGNPEEFADNLRLAWWLAGKRSWVDGVEWMKDNRMLPEGERVAVAEPTPMELSDVQLELRVRKGEPAALVEMGHRYRNGSETIEKNLERAADLYEQAGDAGDSEGRYWLGSCYLYRWGRGRDVSKGLALLRIAAEQGYAQAQNFLGRCYEVGWYDEQLPQDPVEAVRWYRKAAEQHYAAALRNLGHCYEYGIGLEQPDMQEALNYYQQAAQLNDQGAQVDVVRFYDNSRCGLRGDYFKVKEMYRELAEQNVAEAQVEWARRYIFDDEEALRLYRAAAPRCEEGAYQLAECYRLGKRGLAQDPSEAHKWYGEAARRGHILGMTAYADGASDSIGVSALHGFRIRSEREKWYRRAIVLGHVPAMVKLAELYSWREENYSRQMEEKPALGVSAQYQEYCDQMLYWYEKAEETKRGAVDVDAMLKLAELYDPRKPVKRGFRKDKEKAIEWYRRIVNTHMYPYSSEAWDAIRALEHWEENKI